MLECVVNISEGRRPAMIDALCAACAGHVLDVHVDADHHRSVFTLAGAAADLSEATLGLARAAVERIDLSTHAGVHPRLGAVDVVPFVALDLETGPSSTLELETTKFWSVGAPTSAVAVAREWAERAARNLSVPVFLYGDADP